MSGRGNGSGRSERVYEALLSVYPKDFRRQYGHQMAQVFGDLCRAQRERAGLVGLAVLWARTVLDLLRTAASERTRTAPGATFVIPVAGSPRMVRWGGASAIVGAVFSLVATTLGVLTLALLEEPIFNALLAYQDGGSGYSPFIVLLHPIVPELLGTLSGLLFATALVGLYALVSRRSGRLALWGGGLMCLSVVGILVYAVSNTYRMSVAFGGRLGGIYTDPALIVVELSVPLFIVGALILSFTVARTQALGPWSMLPLVVLFAGTVLRMVLIRSGLPVQHLPHAIQEGAVTLLIVHMPELVTNTGWVLLGWVMWRRSGEALVNEGMPTAIPEGGIEQ
ncbi:MAG: hypothetical protein AVDCRST_MAG03-1751 [uncultured Rubrobacteraceae bacterium]|uniref:Uncharacterized protein n=1 Tax=uncultured Rubrobacteraceae bacterium TaxID=349277 RepID=A0A6J4PAZ3_9ACTN|nr:MAG: hypothetical protein AVDCRST_MAG03-1751 [uncultured Rubrobacteraceae bacterium]